MNRLIAVKKSKSYKSNRVFLIITIIGLGLVIYSLMSLSKQTNFNIPIDITATLAASPNTSEDIYSSASEEILNEELTYVYEKRPQIGELIGSLTIPALDRVLPIYEGTTEDQLSIGVGHVVTSVLPGWLDNSVIAGHRRTTFKNLGNLVIDDVVVIESKHGVFTYKIVNIRIVESDDETVIVSTEKATLTLITCYPFNTIVAPQQRYIITAELVQN